MNSQSNNKQQSMRMKKKSSELFYNNNISKDNIKLELDTNDVSNDTKNNKDLNKKTGNIIKFKNNHPDNLIAPYKIGERIAQIKIQEVIPIEFVEVESWKKYNSENTVEPNINNIKTIKCTCNIF